MNLSDEPVRDEMTLRGTLGIPRDAHKVIIFAESSHWDPNWLRTSREYFQGLVAGNLEQALKELRADPKRVYSIECMFFLRLFWESRPDLQPELRDLLNNRRLRLTGSGVTTPDTLVPSGEAILRDLLIGQEWLRSVGVTQEPQLAYFPDCFGHSPNLPALLNAAGFHRSTVTRIDGMWFLWSDLDLPSHFPLKGSSAEYLLKRVQSLDFIWRAAGDSDVLCHWNAFSYGQGEMLADAGLMRIYLYPQLSRPDRSEKTVNRRVKEFLSRLTPVCRTPYLFCPIGMDFNPPIPGLNELLERYNRTVYPSSGVWLINAGMDDYFDLLEYHRDRLPVMELDPNPYWTGFYTSRPSLKSRAYRLTERLSLIEELSVLSSDLLHAPQPLERAWWSSAVSNHHDFITGTSPDRVAQAEQYPMLDAALADTNESLALLASQVKLTQPAVPAARLPVYEADGNELHILTANFHLNLSGDSGGFIEMLRRSDSSELLVTSPSHTIVQYNESGGLWRMGCEFRGGRFKKAAIQLPLTHFEVSEQGTYLRVVWQTRLPLAVLNQTLWMRENDPLIYFEVKGLAPQKTTLTLQYLLPYSPLELRMEAPGGNITRPLAKVYTRPFWPVQQYIYIPNPSGERGFALLLRDPGAVAVDEDGQVEIITQRNAIHEKAYFDLVSLPGMPATGIEHERTAFRGALAFPLPKETYLAPLSRELLDGPWASEEEHLASWVRHELVQIDSEQVFITALKPAWRGNGIILRLSAPGAPLSSPVRIRLKAINAQFAMMCDARERDLQPLVMDGSDLIVPIERSIITIRLLPVIA